MNVLWLQSGGCGGCSMSLLCADTTDFQGHLRDAGIHMLWHPSLSLASGEDVLALLQSVIDDGTRLDALCVEGSLLRGPNGTGRFHMLAGTGLPMIHWVRELAAKAYRDGQTNRSLWGRFLDAIVATPGVDGVFIGPADLSASMGHVGNAAHPEVQAAIEDAIARILKAGKAPGILTPDRSLAAHYLKLGAVFVAVGLDTQLLMRHTTDLAAHFKAEVSAITPNKGATY
jgi:hypothetical protein